MQYESKMLAQKHSKKSQISNSSESESLGEDSDFTDESSLYEKKLNILHIPHIILWKAINEQCINLSEGVISGQEALNFLL